LNALKKQFQIDLSHKQLRDEMKILQACSVFIRAGNGYESVLQRINRAYFEPQDDVDLALRYMILLEK